MKLQSQSSKLILLVLILAVFTIGIGLFLTACNRDSSQAAGEAKDKTLYTCGMHPQVIQDHPGNCPICGMKLTPIRKQAGTASASSPKSSSPGERKIKYFKSSMTPGEISPTPRKDSMGMDMVPVYEDEAAAAESQTIDVDPATTQKMGIRTALVTRGPLRRNIRTVGAIEYDETTLADVTNKFKGWIEKLDVNTSGELVMRGDLLFEIYSPELYSAQREYLLALQQGTNGGGALLKNSALNKIKFFDISDKQITSRPRPSGRLRRGKDGGQGPDGGCRDETLSPRGPRVGLGPGPNIRTGSRLPQTRTGSNRHALLPARPRIPRACDLYLPKRGRENTHRSRSNGIS
jgi:hypothetical protein